MQRTAASGLQHTARTASIVPRMPHPSAGVDRRGDDNSAARHSRMGRRDGIRRHRHVCGRHRCRDRRGAPRCVHAPQHPFGGIPCGHGSLAGPDAVPASQDTPHPQERRPRGERPSAHRPRRGRHIVVLVFRYDIHRSRHPRRGSASHYRSRKQPYRPPPLGGTRGDGADEGGDVVEPVRVDRAAAVGRGARIRSRRRRAPRRIRHKQLHSNHIEESAWI